jgi:transposase-like protein
MIQILPRKGVSGHAGRSQALEARRAASTSTGAIKRIADQLGIHPEALRTWVRQAEIDGGDRPGTTTTDAQRLAELELASAIFEWIEAWLQPPPQTHQPRNAQPVEFEALHIQAAPAA